MFLQFELHPQHRGICGAEDAHLREEAGLIPDYLDEIPFSVILPFKTYAWERLLHLKGKHYRPFSATPLDAFLLNDLEHEAREAMSMPPAQ